MRNVVRRRVVLITRSKIHHATVEHGLREADFARILVHGRHADRVDNQISGDIVAILNHVSGKLAIRIRPPSARRLDNARASHYVRRAHGCRIIKRQRPGLRLVEQSPQYRQLNDAGRNERLVTVHVDRPGPISRCACNGISPRMSLRCLLQRIPQALGRRNRRHSFASPSIIDAVDKRLNIGGAGHLSPFLLARIASSKQTRCKQHRHCRHPDASGPHCRAHHKQNPNTTPSAVEA